MNPIHALASTQLRQIAANTALDAIAEGICEVADMLDAGSSGLDALQSPQAILARVCKAMECPPEENPVVWAAALLHKAQNLPDPIVGHDSTPHTFQKIIAQFPRFPGG